MDSDKPIGRKLVFHGFQSLMAYYFLRCGMNCHVRGGDF